MDATFQGQGSIFGMDLTEGETRGFLHPTPSAWAPVLSFEAKLWCEKEHLFS